MCRSESLLSSGVRLHGHIIPSPFSLAPACPCACCFSKSSRSARKQTHILYTHVETQAARRQLGAQAPEAHARRLRSTSVWSSFWLCLAGDVASRWALGRRLRKLASGRLPSSLLARRAIHSDLRAAHRERGSRQSPVGTQPHGRFAPLATGCGRPRDLSKSSKTRFGDAGFVRDSLGLAHRCDHSTGRMPSDDVGPLATRCLAHRVSCLQRPRAAHSVRCQPSMSP